MRVRRKDARAGNPIARRCADASIPYGPAIATNTQLVIAHQKGGATQRACLTFPQPIQLSSIVCTISFVGHTYPERSPGPNLMLSCSLGDSSPPSANTARA